MFEGIKLSRDLSVTISYFECCISQDLSVTKTYFECSIWILNVMHTASNNQGGKAVILMLI